MRSKEEIEKRIELWQWAKSQFYPDPYFINNIDRMVSELENILHKRTAEKKKWSIKKKKKLMVESAFNFFREPPVSLEQKWVRNEDNEGAYKKAVWFMLTSELHDGVCLMKNEGSDIILEGKGDPPDFKNPREFQFWLKLINCEFEDDRDDKAPIKDLILLYPEASEEHFIITAQDTTFSGYLKFSAEEYEFRVWDHKLKK
jgi:hypothetical protein